MSYATEYNSDSSVSITEQEAFEFMWLAKINSCRICLEKVKSMVKATELTIFDTETEN